MKFELRTYLSRSSVLGSIVVTGLLLLVLVLGSVNQSVSGVFGSYQDRVVLAQYHGESVQSETVELLQATLGLS